MVLLVVLTAFTADDLFKSGGPRYLKLQAVSTSVLVLATNQSPLHVQAGIFGTDHFYVLGQAISSQLNVSESTDASDRKAWLIVAYIMAAATAILILLSLLMMRRIKVRDMPSAQGCTSVLIGCACHT